jgi:PAS domain S-box-containing protein
MLGRHREEVEGKPFLEFMHPDESRQGEEALAEMRAGRLPRATFELHGVRPDASTIWCRATVGPVLGQDGRLQHMVAVVEDVTERWLLAERALSIQRRLLPRRPPSIDGYEMAAACLPAQDVAGDFYDWVVTPDGCLDITVADVMGKGVAAALVMAVLRTALRSGPPELGPAARVGIAADTLALSLGGDGLFVTMFHARLHPATGVLRYVDAGHGYWGIRRRDGRDQTLPGRSLPLGIRDDERFDERTTVLEPEDALVVYSDGLVESEERTVSLSELVPRMGASSAAEEAVRRLTLQIPSVLADDVTAMVLRRLPLGLH